MYVDNTPTNHFKKYYGDRRLYGPSLKLFGDNNPLGDKPPGFP